MRTRLIIFLAALLFAAGCGRGGGGHEDKPLAMVNGEPVSYSEYKSRLGLQSLGFAGVTGFESAGSDAKIEALGLLIEEKLLLQEAARLRVSVGEDEVTSAYREAASDYPAGGFEEAVEKAGLDAKSYRESIRRKLIIQKLVRKRVFDNITVSDEDALAYFKKNSQDFAVPASVRVRQIVLDTHTKAERALGRVRNGVDFAKVASEDSLSPDSKEGGDLGYFSRGEMPPEFDVVFGMKPGEVSDVVETPYGFHVFKLIDRRGSSDPKYDEVKGAVADRLRTLRFEPVYAAWMASLREKAVVEVSEDFMDKL